MFIQVRVKIYVCYKNRMNSVLQGPSSSYMFSQRRAFDQTGNTCEHCGTYTHTDTHTQTHTETHTRRRTHTQTQNVPSSFSREPFSDFNLSFFFSGLLFLLSFPFSFTPFCFLFSPFWVFSAGRHRRDLVHVFSLSLIELECH